MTTEHDAITLADVLPAEQGRVRELLVEYERLGPVGSFGAAVLRQTLALADQAVMSGDVIAMLRAYEELKGCQ